MTESNPVSVSDNTKIAMPIRNIISIVGAVAVSTWAYSGVIERLNRIETQQEIEQSAIELNSEFRIEWPRGTMGSLPADAEQNREIQALQLENQRLMEEVDENDEWIDSFEPPKSVQDTVERVRDLELRLVILETLVDK
jgi:hypothetical protein